MPQKQKYFEAAPHSTIVTHKLVIMLCILHSD